MVQRGAPEDPLRTALAAKGVNLSALFYVVFENLRIPGTPPRRPRLMAPAGPSTSGGRLARQHLTLDPADGYDGPAVVVGWADPARRLAELRTLRAVDAAYRVRFGQRLDLEPSHYGRFLNEAKAFLIDQGFGVTLQDRAAGQAPSVARNPWLILGLILLSTLLLGVLLGAAWVLLAEA